MTSTKGLADWYEEGLRYYPHPKIFSNWMMGEVLRELKEKKIKIENFVLDPKGLADLLMQIDEGIISGKIAKEIFKEMVETKKDAQEIIEEKGLV